MGRGLAVLLIAFGAVSFYAGYSDNTIRNTLGSLAGQRPNPAKGGRGGLDAVLFYGALYLGAKVGGSVVPELAGAAGAAGAV